MPDSRVALVTGASRGIGRAIAVELSKMGFKIAVNYSQDEIGARETADIVSRMGGMASLFQADVSSHDQSKEMVSSIEKDFGVLEVVVLNAGITRDGLLVRTSEENWDKVIDVNLKGMYNVGKWAIRSMMRRKSGKVIAISSVVALTGNPGQVNYCSAKAGVIGFVRALSREVARYGITVNAVAPGYISTDMTESLNEDVKHKLLSAVPLNRAGTPEDVAFAVRFLASEQASYITGQVLSVDGGMS
jgi:3-oxoacyl-[acyl-carrier protein] reductase